MVKVKIDGNNYSGKNVVVDEWNSHAKKEFRHYFSDDYDGADKMMNEVKK